MLDRERTGRQSSPTGAIIDSQSVKTTEAGGPRGYDAGKKINGRKRHALVDTERRNHVWSYDFVEAQTHEGCKLRLMTLIDEYHRTRLAIERPKLAARNAPERHYGQTLFFQGLPHTRP
jgi:hypothetical protein